MTIPATTCQAGYLASDLTLDKADQLRITCSIRADEKGEHRGKHIPPHGEIAKGAGPWEDCQVRTEDYDWGNYCPRDPAGLGIHRCTLPSEHHDMPIIVPTDPRAGEPGYLGTPPPCVCRCGMKRDSGKPKRDET